MRCQFSYQRPHTSWARAAKVERLEEAVLGTKSIEYHTRRLHTSHVLRGILKGGMNGYEYGVRVRCKVGWLIFTRTSLPGRQPVDCRQLGQVCTSYGYKQLVQ
jgi:hypothetical protein